MKCALRMQFLWQTIGEYASERLVADALLNKRWKREKFLVNTDSWPLPQFASLLSLSLSLSLQLSAYSQCLMILDELSLQQSGELAKGVSSYVCYTRSNVL